MSEAAVSYTFEQLQPSAPPARDTPRRLVARATEEAERIREQARSQGYADGRAEGLRDGAAETSCAALALAEAVRAIHERQDELAEALERDAVELALALTAKVLAGVVEAQPERVLDVVRGALRHFTERRRITVLVDPADLQIVVAAIDDLRAQAGGIEMCEVQSDRRVGRGGAIVSTSEGEVDVRLSTQLQRAREVVVAELSTQRQAS